MVERDFEHWDLLLFRDYLIAHLDVARRYQALKERLSSRYPNDRTAYTEDRIHRQRHCRSEASSPPLTHP